MSDNINCWLLLKNEPLKFQLELCNGLGFRIGELCCRLSDREFAYTVGGPKCQINRIYSIYPWKNPLPGKNCPAFYAQFVRRYFIHKLSINPSVFSPTSYSCPLGIHAISAGAVCFPLDYIILHVSGCSFPCPTLSVTLPHEIFSLKTFWNLSFTLVCDHSLFFLLGELTATLINMTFGLLSYSFVFNFFWYFTILMFHFIICDYIFGICMYTVYVGFSSDNLNVF